MCLGNDVKRHRFIMFMFLKVSVYLLERCEVSIYSFVKMAIINHKRLFLEWSYGLIAILCYTFLSKQTVFRPFGSKQVFNAF